MNLKSIYRFFALCLLVVAGQSWATVSQPTLPVHSDPTWNDISGIEWRVNGGAWGNAALTVGQTVEFKFTLHKSELGTHYGDFLKTWIDWSGDGSFDSSEAFLFGMHVVHEDVVKQGSIIKTVDESYEFTKSLVITNAMIGDHWLLTRVTCSESLLTGLSENTSWGYQWDYAKANGSDGYNNLFSPTKYYYQGEAQLVNLHVDANKVPEPGTLALFAVGLAGLGFGKRRLARI